MLGRCAATAVIAWIGCWSAASAFPHTNITQEPPAVQEAKRDSPQAAAPAYVLIDRSDPSFVLFQGIPEDRRQEALNLIQSHAAGAKATLVPWDQFRAGVKDYARTAMIRNDYPNYNVGDGILCLLRAAPGMPWSITWNGGIALTRNDYEWARRQFKSYSQNPGAYRAVNSARADPNNPGAFLPAFGCA